jgi:hypothetical protein
MMFSGNYNYIVFILLDKICIGDVSRISIYSIHSVVIDGNRHIVEVRWALQYMAEQLLLI